MGLISVDIHFCKNGKGDGEFAYTEIFNFIGIARFLVPKLIAWKSEDF
jgi:hypothetical protein